MNNCFLKSSEVLKTLAQSALMALSLAIFSFAPANAADVVKTNNTDNLNLGTSWVNGTAPTSSDVAVWNSTVNTTGTNNYALGGDLSWSGIRISNPAGLVNITNTGGYSLTLGSAGIDLSSATQSLMIQALYYLLEVTSKE